MALPSRPGFFYLIVLFLKRMPPVWLGGIGASIVLFLLAADFGRAVAVAGALAVVIAAVGVEFAFDRRRGIGRRLLFRGSKVSPRRVLALVVALGIVASVSSAIVSRYVSAMHKTVADEVRSRSSPNQKRGFY